MLNIYYIILSSLIIGIEYYSEHHLKNYGKFRERFYYLFGFKTIFNALRISLFFSFVLIFFSSSLSNNFEIILRQFNNLNLSDIYPIYYLPLGLGILILFSNTSSIHRELKGWQYDNENLSYFIANCKYLLFRLVSFTWIMIIFSLIFQLTLSLNLYFQERKLFVLDWLVTDTDVINNYDKGIYASLLLTLLIFFIFNNAFLKMNSEYYEYRSFTWQYVKYFFISVFLGIGVFFGFFSFLNGIYNLINLGFNEWITKENLLGILPIRISSILVTFYLFTYIYKIVIDEKIHFILIGILPFRNIQSHILPIELNKSENLFFGQISFYILNIAVSEYFFINGIASVFLSILNFSILFILDDFKIINDYSNGLNSVLKSHFARLWIFNLLMFITAIVFFVKSHHLFLLCIYIILSAIVFYVYFRNLNSIRFKDKYYPNRF